MFNSVSIALVLGCLAIWLHVEANVPSYNSVLCVGGSDSNGFRPHPIDCSSFYYCDGLNPVVIECPNGNEWDIVNQRCACPRIAQCSCDDDHQPTPTPPTQPPTTTTPDGHECDDGQSYPFPWDCNKYYYCKHGELVIKNCPGHTHFDMYKNKCVGIPWAHCYQNVTSAPSTVTWPPPPPSSTNDGGYNPCNGAEFYPCPWDCSKFFHCDGTIAYLKDCPSGTQWDTKSNRCEWPNIAQCDVSTTTTGSVTESSSGPPRSTTSDGGKSSEEDGNPCKGEEFYPYPGNCSKYYYCDGNKASVKSCPSGTDWDTKSNRCQWPDVANCQT